jgi:hypothetical protein
MTSPVADPALQQLIPPSGLGAWPGWNHQIPVPLSVDGCFYIAGLRLDPAEHLRRREMRLGAVTSTGLLHALWELPLGVPFPRRSLAPMDWETLSDEGRGWAQERHEEIVRVYRPAGVIGCIAVPDRSLAKAVQRVATHPATVRRTAVWMTSTKDVSAKTTALLSRARILGVGVLAVDDNRVCELVRPAESIGGRPAVFRWWQAELAYRNWLKSTAPIGRAVALA